MAYEQRICLFLDILGFREIISETVPSAYTSPDSATSRFEQVSSLLGILNQFGSNVQWANEAGFQATQFSDSLVISFLEPNTPLTRSDRPQHFAFVNLHRLLFRILRSGFLVRGGMSVGSLIHSQGQIFGPALIEAVDLEKKACFPRILSSGDAKQSLAGRLEGEVSDLVRRLFETDTDGDFALNYISYERIPNTLREIPDDQIFDAYSALRDLIQKGLKHEDPKVRAKYDWALLRFLNAVTKFGNPHPQIGVVNGLVRSKFPSLLEI